MKLTVSRNFRKKIIENICNSFDAQPAKILLELVDSLMVSDREPDMTGVDPMIAAVYSFIATDIKAAMERSRKARVRAASRKKSPEAKPAEKPKRRSVICLGFKLWEGMDFTVEGKRFSITQSAFFSRHRRRQAERELNKCYTVNSAGEIVSR
ncbi:MAG: hypothetical protein NC098_06370 [Lachnoclostridium sp.]|nr:hypothetical protein [Lachnoclostridium sp.]